jgi:fatty acid desaturase
MQLRHSADVRTLAWVAMMPVLVALEYARPSLLPYLSPVSFYLAIAAGVIAHNHNHCPTFKSRSLNATFANLISVFYGYPTFAWVPTHNLNHHKFVNRAGDATITWRYTNKHNFLVAGTYFFVSSYWQKGPITDYIRKARANNPALFRRIISQYVIWAGAHVAMFALGCFIYGPMLGAKIWLFSLGLPAFFSLWTIMFFNYVQHVHTDPWSAHNHSRSFVGRWLNFMLFNNGFHGAHHENPGAHWSVLPSLHAQIASQIDPALCHPSFWGFMFKQYIFAPFFPQLGTRQIGRAPFESPFGDEEQASSVRTGEVDAVDPGVNAIMV